MKGKFALLGFLSAINVFWPIGVVAQIHNLPEPQMAATPPPVGLILPIDDSIFLLAAAGMILGLYFLRAKVKL